MVTMYEVPLVPKEVLQLRVASGDWYGKAPTYPPDLLKAKNPYILVYDPVKDNTYKIALRDFEEYLDNLTNQKLYNKLEDAVTYLTESVDYLPEGTMKRNIERFLQCQS